MDQDPFDSNCELFTVSAEHVIVIVNSCLFTGTHSSTLAVPAPIYQGKLSHTKRNEFLVDLCSHIACVIIIIIEQFVGMGCHTRSLCPCQYLSILLTAMHHRNPQYECRFGCGWAWWVHTENRVIYSFGEFVWNEQWNMHNAHDTKFSCSERGFCCCQKWES